MKADTPDGEEALLTLLCVLFEFSRLIAPVTPFLAEIIYKELKMDGKESVHLEDWPNFQKKFIDKNLETEMIEVRKIVSEVLRLRAEAGIKVRQPLQELRIKNQELRKRKNTHIKKTFLDTLSNPNNASKESIFIHFDKSVIGNTILEPGEADASVIAPLQDQNDWTGVALACGGSINENPHTQAYDAVSQAVQKVIAVGASPRALTDCLNYGNPENSEQLSELAEGIRGLKESAEAFSIPFISGNVSLYNCTDDGSSIPPTATVCCIGVLPDARKAFSMQLKHCDSHIALVMYNDLPHLLSFLPSCIYEGNIHSTHVITKGILMALLEMTTPKRGNGGTIGLDIDLSSLDSLQENIEPLLFRSSTGLLLEIPQEFTHPNIITIGRTCPDPLFILNHGSTPLFSLSLPPLHQQWKNSLTQTILSSK